ncbi:hypothetical protein EMIT0111MI5_120093 [Burkholderia sp. IT-111MI5]
MRGALSLISRPYLLGEPFYNACTALASPRRRVCSHVTWSLDPPHSQWIESPPNLAFTQGHNEWESSLPTYSIRRTVVPAPQSRSTSTRWTANRAARSRPC